MSLFIPVLAITCTPDEWQILHRPIVGTGGAQLLLKTLLRTADRVGTQSLAVEDADLNRCYTYAYRYGGGGFQDRFRAIVKAALRAGWVPA